MNQASPRGPTTNVRFDHGEAWILGAVSVRTGGHVVSVQAGKVHQLVVLDASQRWHRAQNAVQRCRARPKQAQHNHRPVDALGMNLSSVSGVG